MDLVEERNQASSRFALLTFGCQMNKNDSEMMSGILSDSDYDETEDLSQADIILLNTCSIREKAEQKVYSQIGRLKGLKNKNPNLIIGVGGCVGQLQGENILKKAPLVDLVFGTSNIDQLPRLIREVREKKGRIAEVARADEWPQGAPKIKRKGEVNAWVSIMRGCDNFCTYCVVPYARGKERSRYPRDVITDVQQLAGENFKEVTLLGQNVNSYGKNLEEEITFPGLLRMVNEVEGVERVRFVTSHPKDFSDELIEAMATLSKVCESIHLPVQSGSDTVLKRMKREYRASEYMDKLAKARERIENLSVTTDIIVGFPGESEEDFEKTRNLVEKVRYDNIFLFKYSARGETAAAKFKNEVPEEVKQRRFEEILAIQNRIAREKNEESLGKVLEVLVEEESKKHEGKLVGRTRTNKIVLFPGGKGVAGKEIALGDLLPVKITNARQFGLEGQYHG